MQLAISSTTIRSFARTYPQGVSLVTLTRKYAKFLAVQNRDNQAIYFWIGSIPAAVEGVLPDDPNDWDAGQITQAETVLGTFGLKVDAGTYLELGTASTEKFYSYVVGSSAVAHVLVG